MDIQELNHKSSKYCLQIDEYGDEGSAQNNGLANISNSLKAVGEL